MRVDLGSFEFDEADRRAIKRRIGYRGGKASRNEARAFAHAAIKEALRQAAFPDPEDLIREAEKA